MLLCVHTLDKCFSLQARHVMMLFSINGHTYSDTHNWATPDTPRTTRCLYIRCTGENAHPRGSCEPAETIHLTHGWVNVSACQHEMQITSVAAAQVVASCAHMSRAETWD